MPQIVISHTFSNNRDITNLMSRLPDAFANNEGELIYDKRNKLRRFTLADGTNIIVKKFKHPNLFQQICYSTFWSNKAKKSYLFAFYLLKIGIDTPQPIAYITYKHFGMVTDYYLATAEVQGTESQIPMRAMNARDDTTGMQKLTDALVPLMIRLHENGFLHGDCNLSNFLCRETASGYEFSVIDINRSKILNRPATYKEIIHNLCRAAHIHTILIMLAKTYAHQRGWEEEKVAKDVLAELAKFEKLKERKKNLKKLITFSFFHS